MLITRLCQRLWLVWDRTPLSGDEQARLEEATALKNRFPPAGSTRDYAWVYDLAKDQYEKLVKIFDGLDGKADAIVKYLGAGTAVVTTVAVFSVSRATSSAVLMLLLLPAFAFAIWSVALAMRARMPTRMPLPSIPTAIDYADAFGPRAKEAFAGMWHEATEILRVEIERKDRAVAGASKWYCRALVLLLLPLVSWPLWRVLEPTPPTRVEINSPPMKVELTAPPAQLKVSPSPD
jgi:hypothetical protein